MIGRFTSSNRDRGAAMVEFALIAPVILMLIFGIMEYGMAFRNRIIVDDAVQEAGRLGAALGNGVDTDIEVLDWCAANLKQLPNNGVDIVKFVEIYRVNPDGSPSASLNFYEFKYTADTTVCDWNPCPQGSEPVNYTGWTWSPASRNVEVGNLDVIGVKAYFSHHWLTGILPVSDKTCTKAAKNSTCWVEETTQRLEPLVFSVGS